MGVDKGHDGEVWRHRGVTAMMRRRKMETWRCTWFFSQDCPCRKGCVPKTRLTVAWGYQPMGLAWTAGHAGPTVLPIQRDAGDTQRGWWLMETCPEISVHELNVNVPEKDLPSWACGSVKQVTVPLGLGGKCGPALPPGASAS